MRKVASISLLCLLLFNWFGYKFVTSYLQKKATSQLDARIDLNDYDESKLIEIRIPLNMPYQNNSSTFERHYGEVDLDGTTYGYVKRKIEDGYLVLKCLPNDAKQRIRNADNILFASNNGLDQEHNGKNDSPLQNVFKSIFSDYDDCLQSFNLATLIDLHTKPLQTAASSFKNVSLPVAEQPPEAIALL